MNDFFASDADRFPLSVHQLTALDASPEELVEAAARLGCAGVCLFTHVPVAAQGKYPVVTEEMVSALRGRLRDGGLVVANVEVFPLDGTPFQTFRPGLMIAEALGATRATAHIHGATGAEAVDRFANFSALCVEHGLTAGLEFNRFSAVPDVEIAAAIVRAVRPTPADLVLDILHHVRAGGTQAQVAQVADLISYAQISDGPAELLEADRWHEAIAERRLPGEGGFAISSLLSPLQSGTVLSVEVPRKSARLAGVSVADRIAQAVSATRTVLARGPAARP